MFDPIIQQLLAEALSEYNDGWTRKMCRKRLAEIHVDREAEAVARESAARASDRRWQANRFLESIK